MKIWIVYAILSMLFAGFTAVVAKQGLVGITSELGLTVRTLFVCLFVLVFAAIAVPFRDISSLRRENLWWLGLSAATTAGSWIFYYKALKDGQVSTIALIDKGSVIVAIVLAALLFKEVITPRMMFGGALMLGGLLIIATK